MPTLFKRRYMRPHIKHPKEVGIGVIILLLTAALCAALVMHAPRKGDPLFEISAGYLQREQREQGAAVVLPEIGLAEWSEPRGVRTFTRDTLYEKIDGRADLYFQYNFKQLTFAKYLKDNDPDQDLQAWLYDMGSADNARGIYQAELSGEVTLLEDLGGQAYRSGSSIFFWKGPMYVSVITIEDQLADAADTLARRLADIIEDQDTASWDQVVLPPGRIPDSLEYLANNAFSLDFLNEVYTAEYPVGEDRVVLFAHRAADAAAAEALLQQYVAFFEEFGRIISRDNAIIVGDGGGVIDAVFVFGRYLAGVSNAGSAALAAQQAAAYRGHLEQLGAKIP